MGTLGAWANLTKHATAHAKRLTHDTHKREQARPKRQAHTCQAWVGAACTAAGTSLLQGQLWPAPCAAPPPKRPRPTDTPERHRGVVSVEVCSEL
eukprot:3138217-Prymnesium_polylepis.1